VGLLGRRTTKNRQHDRYRNKDVPAKSSVHDIDLRTQVKFIGNDADYTAYF
jgi:hypothetical protein